MDLGYETSASMKKLTNAVCYPGLRRPFTQSGCCGCALLWPVDHSVRRRGSSSWSGRVILGRVVVWEYRLGCVNQWLSLLTLQPGLYRYNQVCSWILGKFNRFRGTPSSCFYSATPSKEACLKILKYVMVTLKAIEDWVLYIIIPRSPRTNNIGCIYWIFTIY